MVLQAKLERRQRHQAEKSCKTNEESHSGMLGSIDNIPAGHPQSIPPPSEPVLPAGNKVLSPKAASCTITAHMAPQAVYVGGETVPEHNDFHTQFTEDKSEARHSEKSELEYENNYMCFHYLIKPLLATARAALCVGAVHLFVYLSVAKVLAKKLYFPKN